MNKKTRWIEFIGGNNLLFTLITLLLTGVIILVFSQLTFLFEPIVIMVSSILMPFVIALLMYYVFNPVINFMEKHHIKRLWGVAILFLVILGLLSVLIVVALPMLRDQVLNFIESFPGLIETLSNNLMGWVDNLPGDNSLSQFIETGEEWLGQLPQNISQYLSSGFTGLASVVSGLTNVVVTLVTFPIVLFFLLKDGNRFFTAFLKMTPPKCRQGFIDVSTEINNQVGSYVKGQLIIATSIGVMMYAGFTIIGLEYNGILSVVAGFTSIIPYIGPALAFVPALVIALIDSWFMVLKLIIVWFVVQFVDGNLIEPNVMGRQLNVHPLTIIVVLLVMGDLLGIFGLIFGVPIYAILKVIVAYSFQQFKKRYNKYYGDIAGKYEVHTIEEAIHGEENSDTDVAGVE